MRMLLPAALVPLLCSCSLIGLGHDELPYSTSFESFWWSWKWDESNKKGNYELIDEDPERRFEPLRGRALRVAIPAGKHYGITMQYDFDDRIGHEPEEIYFRYYLRLADDWEPQHNGKLPGISATYGVAGWGGRPTVGDDGWSARGLFKRTRDGVTPTGFYCYHMDMKGKYGNGWAWGELGHLEKNRWYCIEQYARVNTPGEPDGILRGWIDGALAFEKTDVRMRSTDTIRIESIWLDVYYGGKAVPETDHHLYIDELVIAAHPIGPLAPPVERSLGLRMPRER